MIEQEKFFWRGIVMTIFFIVGTFIITIALYFANKIEKKRFSKLIDEKFQDLNKGKYGLFKGCETTICSECKIKARCCEEALYFYYNPTV